jgi:NAD(P)-dependent dehydrogenase (short-subunit alcohol dehydrogenase family)
MARVLITGAGRGIGLELARQYVERGDTVLAGARNPAGAQSLRQMQERHQNRLAVLPLEVADEQSVDNCWHRVHELTDGLDILINNAAINPGDAIKQPYGLLDSRLLFKVIEVNAAAPLLVAQRFHDLLRASAAPRIVNISSGAGSLASIRGSGPFIYSTSKAALNMLTRILAFNVRDEGIIVVALDPGWVRTDMGGAQADLAPEESVAGILRVVDGLTLQGTGRFLRYDGGEVPW